ncbi:alkaline phosphatase D family protein [Gloeobacter morelensis MG652769]|uniref:Alkaline phosphatase D family protein n=2 Tax=Gloeobacter TaxID=33071 RepID=A0ABY3PSZ6_9CYAN|nr:alkaline phosphatase D family protein [Gloeobacter morelensis MG652769]
MAFDRSSLMRLFAAATGRRRFLAAVGACGGAALVQRVHAEEAGMFSLGVASGDPLADGVVLWTRLAPKPLGGGGMGTRPVPVQWQVAKDVNMRQVVQRGTAVALPEMAHSVHVELHGLEPARSYWYQFKTGSEVSPVGRTRTAPAPGARVDRLRFAFASCQHYEHAYYSAYRDMAAAADLDFVVHLGDYIYERGPAANSPRKHDGPEITTLEQYRNRYALYKLDPSLQAAHAAAPWIVTWDDHEVDNNYATLIPEDDQTPQAFAARRAAAYQAYYEHMPLRLASLPKGADLQLFRRFTFGDLAELHVLDTRQYRSDQPCGDRLKPRCPEALAEAASMLGDRQERWLLAGLNLARARWNVIAQQTVMAQFDVDPRPGSELFNLDQWDGYVAARERLLRYLAARRPSNPVVITGDIHSNWVFDLKSDFANPDSATVATEFAGTSISSNFSKEFTAQLIAAMPANPHTKFFNGDRRGYTLCTLTPKQWQTDLRVVANPIDPESTVSTLASFVVEDGRPGAQKI